MLKAGSTRFLPLLLIPLGFLVYLGALGAPFVYDDRLYVVNNESIRDLSNFLDFSATRYVGMASFALNYRLGGLSPFGYHLVNVAVHSVNSLLVFCLVMLTFRTPLMERYNALSLPVACVSSVIFLAHPLNTQAVTYVAQRFASLATFFYLLAIVLYIEAKLLMQDRERGTMAWLLYALALISAILAMKTKEISFTLPFMAVLHEAVFFGIDRSRKGAVMRLLFYSTLLIIPLSLIGTLGGGGRVAEGLRELQLKEAVTIDRYTYALTQFSVIVTYLRLFFFPVGQKIDYDYPLSHSLFEARTLVPFLFLVSLLCVSIFVLMMSRKKGRPFGVLFSFGIFWFFIALFVESFAVPIQDVIFEHRMYLPSIGLTIASAAALFWAVERLASLLNRGVSYGAAAVFLLVFLFPPLSYAAHKRNIVWNDELKLLNEAIGESSGKERLYYIRAMVLINKGDLAAALKDADETVELEPRLAETYNLRGYIRSGIGRHEESITDFNKAIELDPLYYRAAYNRARSYTLLKKHREAIADYARVLSMRPDFADAYNNRGVVYAETGEIGKAMEDLNKACAMNHAPACGNLKALSKKAETGRRGP